MKELVYTIPFENHILALHVALEFLQHLSLAMTVFQTGADSWAASYLLNRAI